MPIELGFILMRLAEMAEADESLREEQPWKAFADAARRPAEAVSAAGSRARPRARDRAGR